MLLSGVIFFVEVEHWNWVDALYYYVLTLATVGTGDFVPQTSFESPFDKLREKFGRKKDGTKK